MKKKLYCLALTTTIVLNLFAQSNQTRHGFLSFNETQIIYEENPPSFPKMAWFSNNPDAKIDSRTLYGDQTSICIPSTPYKETDVHFYFSNRDIVGKMITFKGKYKYERAHGMSVYFSIMLDTFLRTNLTEVTSANCNEEEDWKEFSVEMPLERTSNFFFRVACRGEGTLWLSDCKVYIDGQSLDILEKPYMEADKDQEFLKGSGIQTVNTDNQTLNNLEVLGKVWGFLKYYHPNVTAGKYNWDFELFRILPQIAEAKNKAERNRIISKWIDQYGEIEETADYTVKDSTQFHRYASLSWLEDTQLFDKELSDKLVKVKNAKRNGVLNYYLPQLSWKEEVPFTRDMPYPDISWNDLGYRILTAYRMWNAIEYSFPYKDLTDNKWSTILGKYLKDFIIASSEEELDNTIKKLATEIDDSHGGLQFNKPFVPMRGLPIALTQTSDGKLVVESTQLREIERGAVIMGVKDETADQIIEKFRSITPASNERTLLRDVARDMFLTQDEQTTVKVSFQNRISDKEVPTQTYTMQNAIEKKKPGDYQLNSKNIVYIDMGEVLPEQLMQIMNSSNHAKGLILDLRKYPRGSYTKDIMENYLYPRPTPYMWFSMNSKNYPGNYFLDIKGDVGLKENPNYFKGKIAILVNEGTQSFGELSAIAFSVAPRSAVIGTQTAGADGHIGYVFLPRGIQFNYTMAGAFYPNWGVSQRSGVKIDIPIEQTVENVEAGDDLWIMKAIEYIEK